MLQRRRDIDTEAYAKFWTGRIGRWLFGLARTLTSAKALPAPMTHRPAELSLGMAAEQLFATLPKDTRQQLRDLPAVVHRLGEDAQKMRCRLEELQQVLADTGKGEEGRRQGDAAVEARRRRIVADLEVERDLVQQRLNDAVRALETIRLNLLRLHAGSGTVQRLTTDLDLARELRLERRVAIKLLRAAKAVDPVARERFLVEARTAAQLTHPNIVPIFAVDELSDVVFFAMAYIEGQTLGQRVRERGPLPPKEAARLLRDVGWALAHAHERGVMHRDVKPDNILLDAATGRALVSDFGIARVGAGGGMTGPREVVGTAEFMSPEQASGLGVDARSDLYSLGVVGYYALSGQLPFAVGDSYEMVGRHIAVPPRRLASVAPGVPRRLASIIDRCLLNEPEARFTSGAHLADAVRLAVAVPVGPPIALRAFLGAG